ncbi:hypothetical protein KP77_05420 [Jeotgalibacillus alimentarius]|uniref:Uncharacterized protein n=1 Tax=Jeotgalibacillus alimentarius TaxID=135826 RepID=A0A0C2WAH5_9BACL|nr:hypothetical protein [Jeotgalibacillus alimentarius]KIL53566.1 hypothetical protein KP77_05420 [Jeotgalibacillus alimentarius]
MSTGKLTITKEEECIRLWAEQAEPAPHPLPVEEAIVSDIEKKSSY